MAHIVLRVSLPLQTLGTFFDDQRRYVTPNYIPNSRLYPVLLGKRTQIPLSLDTCLQNAFA